MKKKPEGTQPYTSKQLGDELMQMAKGGDMHQMVADTTLTTQQGVPVADDQNSLKAGANGPVLLEDFVLREKLFHFDHERIPERVVHARGFGAHGYFETYESLSSVTKAHLFQKSGQKTPAFVRFSTVAGNKGSADLVRDVRGFAVKLYTEEGNWDLVGNNIPVFFIQDPVKFPDLIHAAKDEPDCGFPQAQTAHDNFWDFISLTPESMHMIMWIMSDRTLPRSFRFMEGFGVHTFRLINAHNKSTFVKFHWKPKLGLQSVLWDEAVKINGADPDYHRRDLWHAIQEGHFPEWELGVQLFDEAFCERFPFDILDSTKLIPEEWIPVLKVGRLVLDRCVDNFFAETEQVAFCTQNIVSGIDFTNDPLLQGRNFSYLDTQLKRLGSPNFTHLPINAPKCPFANFQQDGHMAFHNPKGRANYSPNSWHEGPRENPGTGFNSFPQPLDGSKLRARSEKFADHYSQAAQFYLSQHPVEQKHLQDALIFELSKVKTKVIRMRMVGHLLNINQTLANTVEKGLGLEQTKPCETARPAILIDPSDKLSILKVKTSFEGRSVGILVTENAPAKIINDLIKEIKKAKATFKIIAPTVNGITLDDNTFLPADEKTGGAASVLFDAVAIFADPFAVSPDKDAGIKTLEFIVDAYNHCKYIAYLSKNMPALENHTGMQRDAACIALDEPNGVKDFLKGCQNLRFWERQK